MTQKLVSNYRNNDNIYTDDDAFDFEEVAAEIKKIYCKQEQRDASLTQASNTKERNEISEQVCQSANTSQEETLHSPHTVLNSQQLSASTPGTSSFDKGRNGSFGSCTSPPQPEQRRHMYERTNHAEESSDRVSLSEDQVSPSSTYEGAVFNNKLVYKSSQDVPQSIETLCQTNNTENIEYRLTENIESVGHNDIQTCPNCSTTEIVQNVDSLSPGQHISMPGQYLQNNHKVFYEHHAIITDVREKKDKDIVLVLIHFTKKGNQFTLCQETKTYDITETKLKIVNYDKAYKPPEIVKRAQQTLKINDNFKVYNLLTTNCEHFATWCAVGTSVSFQVQNLQNVTADAVSILFGSRSKIAKCINRLFLFTEKEIHSGFQTAAPAYALSGTAAVYLTYAIIITVLHVRQNRANTLCLQCFKGKLLDVWLTFGAVEAIALTPLITDYVFPLLAIKVDLHVPFPILEVLLSASFQISVPRLRKALSSPFSVDCKKVADLGEMVLGDMISICYYGINYKGIVTNLQPEEDDKCCISIVYYGVQSLYRTIVEKPFKVDKESIIYVFDCKPFSTYSDAVVVKRARSRIGETKWNMFSNRTIHFLYWAKRKTNIREIETSSSMSTPRAHASLYIQQIEIHSSEDLKTGDVVKCNAIGIISDTGICSSITSSSERKFEIEVYKLSILGKVFTNKYIVDLNKDTMYVNIYSSIWNKEERVKNAMEVKTKGGSWLTTGRFIEHCIQQTTKTEL